MTNKDDIGSFENFTSIGCIVTCQRNSNHVHASSRKFTSSLFGYIAREAADSVWFVGFSERFHNTSSLVSSDTNDYDKRGRKGLGDRHRKEGHFSTQPFAAIYVGKRATSVFELPWVPGRCDVIQSATKKHPYKLPFVPGAPFLPIIVSEEEIMTKPSIPPYAHINKSGF
jgi:hypothetical protein